MTKIQQPTIQQIEATNKAYKLRNGMNDNKLSELLKTSKVTLYTRFRRQNWTDQEILYLEYRTNKNFKDAVDKLKILNHA